MVSFPCSAPKLAAFAGAFDSQCLTQTWAKDRVGVGKQLGLAGSGIRALTFVRPVFGYAPG